MACLPQSAWCFVYLSLLPLSLFLSHRHTHLQKTISDTQFSSEPCQRPCIMGFCLSGQTLNPQYITVNSVHFCHQIIVMPKMRPPCSLGERNGNPFQYSCLENPMDRGAWWATVHGTQLRTPCCLLILSTKGHHWVLSWVSLAPAGQKAWGQFDWLRWRFSEEQMF